MKQTKIHPSSVRYVGFDTSSPTYLTFLYSKGDYK